MVFVKYVIPEDGDEPEHPNVFMCGGNKAASALTLGEIEKEFPVPGKYHFRFLRKTTSGKVWFDVTDRNGAVPSDDNEIFAKVSRVGTQHYQAPSSSSNAAQRPVNNSQSNNNGHVEAAPASSAPVRKPSLDVWDSKSPQEVPREEGKRRNSERLLKFDDDPSGNTPSKSPIHDNMGDASGSGLLDFGGSDDIQSASANSASNSNSNMDLFGLDPGVSIPISPSPPGNIGGQTHNPLGGQNPVAQGQAHGQGANGMNPMMGGANPMMQGMNGMSNISNMGMGGFQPPMGQGQQGQQQGGRKNDTFNALDAFSSMGNNRSSKF